KDWIQMLPGMVLWGFWLGVPTSTAYIVTSADKNRLTLTFTVISSSWSFGYIFSPALGGYMAEKVGMRTVFYTSFLLYALAALILAFISSQHAPTSQQKTSADPSTIELLKDKKLIRMSAFFASIMFITMMSRPLVPQFLADAYHYEDFEIGVLGSIAFFGSAVLGIILGRVGDRWRKEYALAASMVSCGISLTIMLLTGDLCILMAAFFLSGASYITWSLMSAIIGPQAPEHVRAKWISIPQTISMFASIIAPYVGGVLYSILLCSPFIVTILAAAVLAIFAFLEKF
ncbi:MAG: MFS transporter, partial [Candidatus Bathyarchaeia archaeon]